jgi:hypothetical protein
LSLRAALLIFVSLNAEARICVIIDSDQVLAKDLTRADARLASLDSDTAIGATPLAGFAREIKGRELAALLWSAGHPADSRSFPDICVQRTTRELTVEQLQPVLDGTLRAPVSILEFSHYRVPSGVMEFPLAGLTRSGLWHGRVVYGSHHSFLVWARIRVDRAPASESARKGFEVTRGDRITVEVTSGSARLAFAAIAESPGQAGDSILIRNPENGRLFQAKVWGEGKVRIQK